MSLPLLLLPACWLAAAHALVCLDNQNSDQLVQYALRVVAHGMENHQWDLVELMVKEHKSVELGPYFLPAIAQVSCSSAAVSGSRQTKSPCLELQLSAKCLASMIVCCTCYECWSWFNMSWKSAHMSLLCQSVVTCAPPPPAHGRAGGQNGRS